MKKLLILLSFLMIANLSYAQSYLIVDKNTTEIISLSPSDDAQLETGWEKIILPQNFNDIELTTSVNDYKYKNGKFILNIKKISDKEIEKEKFVKLQKERKLITERMHKIARDQLIEEGAIKE